jgi:hypothetical protein
MGLRTLDQFIADHDKKPSYHSNAHVRRSGFETLYVRLGPRYIQGVLHPRVLDIANVTVRRKGCGIFTQLVEELHARGFSLYVESVLNERFERMLPRLGFVRVTPPGDQASFFLAHDAPIRGIRSMEVLSCRS